MMLLLYFRPVTEKKTPLLRNHSICSGPQRFPFVLTTLLSETSISNGLALRNQSKPCSMHSFRYRNKFSLILNLVLEVLFFENAQLQILNKFVLSCLLVA